MSGLAFDALLPDFAVADRPAAAPRLPDFVPLAANDANRPGTQFQPLSGSGTTHADGRSDAVARNVARDAYAQQEQAEPAADREDELDRQWEAVERTHEAESETLAELAGKHEAELSRLRAAHTAEIASLTVHSIGEMEKRIAAAVQDHLVSILGTVMSAQHQRRTVEQFAAKAAAMATDGRGVQVRVSGPAQLLDALRAELGDDAKRYMLVPAETAELEAVIDETVLSTRFSDWHSALERVVA